MFTPIHQVLGIEPGELTRQLIDHAIENKVVERSDLDWKSALYNRRDPNWKDEAAKDISAMANSGGGWIVFGVREDGETDGASGVESVHWDAGEQQSLLQVAYAHIGPPVVGLEFHDIPVEGGSVVMMRIPDSKDAPHFARKNEISFIAPRRNGPHTEFMSDREIERGFRERFQQQQNDERELQQLYESTVEPLDPSAGMCMVISAIPIEPSTATQSIEQNEVHQLVSGGADAEIATAAALPKLFSWSSGEVKKGLRQWVYRSDPRASSPNQKRLFDDGSLSCGYRLGALTLSERAKHSYPVGEPNHCVNTHVESAIIDFFSLLRRYAQNRNRLGGYNIQAGLIGNPNEPLKIRIFDFNWGGILGPEYSEPIFRSQPVKERFDPLAPMNDYRESIRSIALDILNQGGIEHLSFIKGQVKQQ